MTTVFHARLYGRFIETQSNLRRNKLHITNQGSNFVPALKSTSHFLAQSIVSRRSDSSSETNSSCCYRSDA